MKIREIELGGYIEFNRKPTLDETGKAIEKILNFIYDDVLSHPVVTVRINHIYVFIHDPVYYAESYALIDPLGKLVNRRKRQYTIGCKAVAEVVIYNNALETELFTTFSSLLREGVEPFPLEEVE